jgi:hypothetical protein
VSAEKSNPFNGMLRTVLVVKVAPRVGSLVLRMGATSPFTSTVVVAAPVCRWASNLTV